MVISRMEISPPLARWKWLESALGESPESPEIVGVVWCRYQQLLDLLMR